MPLFFWCVVFVSLLKKSNNPVISSVGGETEGFFFVGSCFWG